MKQIIYKNLKVGDYIIDINGEDCKGYGRGRVITIFEDRTFFTVKFPNRKLLVMYDQSFFRYDRSGKLGAKRALTLKEFRNYYKYGYLQDDILEPELLNKIIKKE